ncbi:hypothetical protein GIB67_026274 [Kingdonia uniflora]|uniref:ABC transporter domain-containing protein n=1 Tax=Kingdonia uniflora TaxID=39325 RepID=A0A7J7LA36_9MAGN|nr:hypothetical protein GIB67_026274 [Kingdonia uniflora]
MTRNEEEHTTTPNGRLESVIISSCYPITLKFIDVCYSVKLETKISKGEDKHILSGITGMVSPGEILAVLGPSGSGKSTLLNALSGRLKGDSLTGTILANGRKLTKPILRRTGFVTQDDILYPQLTVKETLIYCSLLRLPSTLSKQEKTAVAESVILELGLGNCENTIIGNSFIRGVSGGERKRVSIGHEMLVNPSLLILDEPTSGLDSTAAHRLMLTLDSLARKGKTIVTAIHQPSSRVYQMFHSLLVLSEGRCLYFGKGPDAMSYFKSVGFSPSFPVNPADFLLDLANGVCDFDDQYEEVKPNIKHSLLSLYNNLLAPKVRLTCMDATTTKAPRDGERSIKDNNRCSTSNCSNWFNQFTVLLRRGLQVRKHESFNPLRVFHVVVASMLAGFMWWHSDFRDVQDRLGLLFFVSIFWGVLPSINSVFAFPQDRAMFIKERASGMYTLSSYFLARIIGDLPMELILPAIFISATYWMAWLKPELGAFLLTLCVLLGNVVVAQGLGLVLGAAIMDAKQASTMTTVAMLVFVLTGGYYVQNVPSFLGWIKYTSFTYYCYRLLVTVQYGDKGVLWSLLGCSHHHGSKAGCRFFEEQIHSGVCIAALVFMSVGYRLLAYMALRRIKT